MTTATRLALTVAALALSVGGAHAGAEDELEALFPPGQPVCYAARFDAAHLAVHADQSVVAIRVMRGYPNLRLSDETSGEGGRPSLSAQLIVTFRDAGRNGTPRQFGTLVMCRADRDGAQNGTSVRCGIECDGGDFVAARTAEGALHFAIADGRALRIAGGCTNHRDLRALGNQTGDRVFTLAPKPMDVCR